MEINVESAEPSHEQQQPLLETPQKPPKTPRQKVTRKTFKCTANLIKLLPTGSVLTFQILSPILTHQGQCHTKTSHTLALGLLAFCGVLCFVLSFTDSFRDYRGKVRYGLATFSGLWVIEGSVNLLPEEAEKYRIKFIDFVHACMSMLVFAAVALFDQNVVKCLCPNPSKEVEDLLVTVPVGIGVICGLMFLKFPSRRHGVGSPLSKQ